MREFERNREYFIEKLNECGKKIPDPTYVTPWGGPMRTTIAMKANNDEFEMYNDHFHYLIEELKFNHQYFIHHWEKCKDIFV